MRRRCWWCAVTLRWWQLNSCRRCKRALIAAHVGPPCPSRSRWYADPDRVR